MTKPPICEKHNVPRVRRSDKGWRCPECKKEVAQKRYQAKRDEILAASKERYRTDPKFKADMKARARAKHLRVNYQITPEEYDKLFEEQNGKCAVCKRTQLDEKHQFGVDHDHRAGTLRGLLCKRCNLMLGNALDDPKILREGAEYLELAGSIIDFQAEKILEDWSRCAYYVYLRPLDYRFYNPSAEFAVHWKVTVEYRGLEYKQHVGEGMNLSEVIKKLGKEVPLRKPKLAPRHSLPPPTERTQIVVKKRPVKKGKKKRALV